MRSGTLREDIRLVRQQDGRLIARDLRQGAGEVVDALSPEECELVAKPQQPERRRPARDAASPGSRGPAGRRLGKGGMGLGSGPARLVCTAARILPPIVVAEDRMDAKRRAQAPASVLGDVPERAPGSSASEAMIRPGIVPQQNEKIRGPIRLACATRSERRRSPAASRVRKDADRQAPRCAAAWPVRPIWRLDPVALRNASRKPRLDRRTHRPGWKRSPAPTQRPQKMPPRHPHGGPNNGGSFIANRGASGRIPPCRFTQTICRITR